MNLFNYIGMYQKGEKPKTQAKRKNDIEFMNQLTEGLLKTLACFTWNNLPDTVDARMLEMSAILNGTSLIAKDPVTGALFSLISVPDGSLTLYGYPAGSYGYGLNGYNKHFNLYVQGGDNIPTLNGKQGTADAVMLKDNLLMYPFINYIAMYAERIADATRSIDVIARNLKSPAIIKADPASAESVKKVLSDINMNISYIVGLDETPYSKMEAIQTGASPEALKALYEYVSDLKSEMATLLGINNNPDTTKRERMLVDEVNANNAMTSMNIKVRLKCREEFCKQVNELFGTDISVEINPAIVQNQKTEYNKEEDGGQDGNNISTQQEAGNNA